MKSNLEFYPGSLHPGEGPVQPGKIEIDGLLAEDVLARIRCLFDHLRMGVRARADENGIDFGVIQKDMVIRENLRNSEFSRAPLGCGRVDIRDGMQPGLGYAMGKIGCMEPADPAGPDYSDTHLIFSHTLHPLRALDPALAWDTIFV
jgi:hypothetical protein